MRKKFIAQTGPNNSIKLFEAETGRLHRMISVGETISSQPICTDTEVFVTTTAADGRQHIKYFSLPGGNIIRSISN